jgi:hypothetical protein
MDSYPMEIVVTVMEKEEIANKIRGNEMVRWTSKRDMTTKR